MLSYLSVRLSRPRCGARCWCRCRLRAASPPLLCFGAFPRLLTVGQAFAPPRYAGGNCKFAERGLFSFRNIVCRRIRTWLPGLSLLHGGAGDSHPA